MKLLRIYTDESAGVGLFGAGGNPVRHACSCSVGPVQIHSPVECCNLVCLTAYEARRLDNAPVRNCLTL